MGDGFRDHELRTRFEGKVDEDFEAMLSSTFCLFVCLFVCLFICLLFICLFVIRWREGREEER